MRKASDEELVEDAKRGVDDAFTQLYRRHERRLRYLVGRMLRDYPNDAEDVVSAVFTKAFRSIDRFEGKSKVSTWLHTIAVRDSLMFLRKSGSRVHAAGRSVPLEIEGEDGSVSVWDIPDDDRAFEQAEARADLAKILPYLSPCERITLEDRFLHGFDVAETADRRAISIGAVKSYQFRALRKARGIMDEMQNGTMAAMEPIEVEQSNDPIPSPAQDRKKCSPCEEAGRFRFADGECDGVPMCVYCEREAKRASITDAVRSVRTRAFEWAPILDKMASVSPGGNYAIPIPAGVDLRKFAAGVSARCSQEKRLKSQRWSISTTMQPGFVVVSNRGRRDSTAPAKIAHVPRHFPMTPVPVINAPAPTNGAAMVTVRVPVATLDKIEAMLHEQWQKRSPEEKAKAAEALLASL